MKVQLKVKCASCGSQEDKVFNIVDKDHPIEWRCPDCGAVTTINFSDIQRLKQFETRSDNAARIPRRGD